VLPVPVTWTLALLFRLPSKRPSVRSTPHSQEEDSCSPSLQVLIVLSGADGYQFKLCQRETPCPPCVLNQARPLLGSPRSPVPHFPLLFYTGKAQTEILWVASFESQGLPPPRTPSLKRRFFFCGLREQWPTPFGIAKWLRCWAGLFLPRPLFWRGRISTLSEWMPK